MTNLIRFLFLSILIGSAATGDAALAALVVTGYTDATNDRFSNNASFIGNGFDLSGIGQSSTGRWATAISRNVVISAAHFAPSGQISFQPDNNPSSTPVARTIVSGSRVGSSDLYVSVLNQPLPDSISHYSFSSELLTGRPPDGVNVFLDSAGIYQDLNAYMFGLSPFNKMLDPHRSGSTDQAIGRNLISGYSENFPFQSNTDNDTLILFFDGVGTTNHVDFESRVAAGDSGAPLFVNIGGDFRLLGINSFRFDDNSGSGATYIGNHTAFISGYIGVHAVPEPGTFAVMAFCSVVLMAKRFRTTQF